MPHDDGGYLQDDGDLIAEQFAIDADEITMDSSFVGRPGR